MLTFCALSSPGSWSRQPLSPQLWLVTSSKCLGPVLFDVHQTTKRPNVEAFELPAANSIDTVISVLQLPTRSSSEEETKTESDLTPSITSSARQSATKEGPGVRDNGISSIVTRVTPPSGFSSIIDYERAIINFHGVPTTRMTVSLRRFRLRDDSRRHDTPVRSIPSLGLLIFDRDTRYSLPRSCAAW